MKEANNCLLTDETLLLINIHQKLKSQNAIIHQVEIHECSQKDLDTYSREENIRIEEVCSDVERYYLDNLIFSITA